MFNVTKSFCQFKVVAKQSFSSNYLIDCLEPRDALLSGTEKVTELGIYFAEELHRLRKRFSI